MKTLIFSIFISCSMSAFAQQMPDVFTMSLSQIRSDGILLHVTPEYTEPAEVYVTMSPDLCFSPGYPSPMPAGVELLFNTYGTWAGGPLSSYLDTKAPDGVNYCYMLVGRGMVEASGWGYRTTDVQPKPISPSGDKPKLYTSRDRVDGVEIQMVPPLTTELTDLMATPDVVPNVPPEKDICPQAGTEFAPKPDSRWAKVMDHFFNGRYYLDTRAAYEIDLCYFLVSKRTGLVVDSSVGYRKVAR